MRQSNKHIQEPALYLRLLVTKQAELLGELKSRRDDIDGLREPAPEADQPAFARDSSIAQGVSAIESSEFKRVNAALEKMRNGAYGVCEHCGSSIPAVRLNAIPWAERCLKCEAQSTQEQATAMGSAR